MLYRNIVFFVGSFDQNGFGSFGDQETTNNKTGRTDGGVEILLLKFGDKVCFLLKEDKNYWYVYYLTG